MTFRVLDALPILSLRFGERLQAAFDTHGKVALDTLDQVDWPTLPDPASEGGG